MSNKDNDAELFKHAMKGVKPLLDKGLLDKKRLNHEKTPKSTSKKVTSTGSKRYTKTNTPYTEDRFINSIPPLSNHISEWMTPESFLSFSHGGVQPRYFRKLKLGNVPMEATLDLHGRTLNEARTALASFIEKAYDAELRGVHIIHGKGYRTGSDKPLMKNHVNTWLRQLPHILAFCSCKPKHGGTGALYVLLCRNH